MGFERYYQVKILSKQLNFPTILLATLVPNYKLNPLFVTGFVVVSRVIALSVAVPLPPER
jgi:hypothetical protein